MKVSEGYVEQLDKGKPRKKCRKWRLWVYADGERRSRRFTGTYTEAQDALESFKAELSCKVPCKETFGAYAESWRVWRAKSGNFAPNTSENDLRCVRAFRRSPISDMRLEDVTPEDCRESLLWIKENPVRCGELSNTSMNKMHAVMHAIFKQAVGDGKIAGNPLDGVAPPKVDTKERAAMEPREFAAFLESLSELPLDGRLMAVYLIAYLGLRRAEACALLDSDVRDGYAFVRSAVKERNGKVDKPKSRAGVRTLPVPQPLQGKIGEWRALRRALGFADSPYLACNTEGGLLRPQLLYRWWAGDSSHNGARDAIGCTCGLHDLRHSNLSLMARHMSPFDLQRYAGWSSIEPAKVYIHENLDAVTLAVNNVWGAEGGPVSPLLAPPEGTGQSF